MNLGSIYGSIQGSFILQSSFFRLPVVQHLHEHPFQIGRQFCEGACAADRVDDTVRSDTEIPSTRAQPSLADHSRERS